MKLLTLTALALALLTPPPPDATEVDFAVLSDFEYEEGKALPESVTKFDKKEIKVSGFMKSEDGSSEGKAQYFILVNDACGCEGIPKLNEMIFCTMADGEETEIKPNTATITGTLHVSEVKEEGVVISLYTMEVTKVE